MELQVQDAYDLAFLDGGHGRVLDVALVELVETGRVRVQRSGYLSVVVDEADGPVERAVLDALLARRARTCQELRVAVDPQVCAGLTRHLAGSGLLVTTASSRLLGALDRSRPLGRWALTPAGRHRRGRPLPADAPGRSRYAVARGGVAAMADAVLRDALLGRLVPRRARTWSWGWAGADGAGGVFGCGQGGSACGGGSSCGGSSCGGGSGCGGGGGCGGGS